MIDKLRMKEIEDREELEILDQFSKLLARENISFIIGEFRTASFDLKNRIMYLPNWKCSKSMKMRLRAHEVGHSLYTPPEGWHKEIESNYDPKFASYINVVEDERIDRTVYQKFPGLKKYILEGNKELLKINFFEDVTEDNYQYLNLIDRLNLFSKFKLNNMFKFQPKNDIEKSFQIRFITTSSFREVSNLAKEIYTYEIAQIDLMKSNKIKLSNTSKNKVDKSDIENTNEKSTKDFKLDQNESEDNSDGENSSKDSNDNESDIENRESIYSSLDHSIVSKTEDVFKENDEKLKDVGEIKNKEVVTVPDFGNRKTYTSYDELGKHFGLQ